MSSINEQLYNFGNLIRSSAADADDANLMRAFEQLRAEANEDVDVLATCNFHGTPLDMAIQWKRDALVAPLAALYVSKINFIDDDDESRFDRIDYDNDPGSNLLDALRTASELGRVDNVRAILDALQRVNATVSSLERHAPPGSEPVLVSAVRGFEHSHEYPESITDCSNHGYDDCGYEPAAHRSVVPSEHTPATSLAIVELLLRAGVDVHAANEMERMCTGFCAALEEGHVAIARALLAHDASVARTPRMHQGHGALQAAIDGDNLECVRLVIESCGGGGAELAGAFVPASASAAIVDYLQLQREAPPAAPSI
jgi:hypothetical protein